MAGKDGTVLCHSDRTGCWTRVSPNWKEAISSISTQFHHMPERYERVRVGWHCAKVKGHAELTIEKPRVKTLSYDFTKLHHSNTNSFFANVHLCQFFYGLGHKKVTWLHIKVKVEGAPKVLLCSKYGAIPTIISGVMAFWKKNAMRHFSLIGRHLERSDLQRWLLCWNLCDGWLTNVVSVGSVTVTVVLEPPWVRLLWDQASRAP